jgi:hypothetical protein
MGLGNRLDRRFRRRPDGGFGHHLDGALDCRRGRRVGTLDREPGSLQIVASERGDRRAHGQLGLDRAGRLDCGCL